MTNTNDFRRYSYSTDPTYLINQFDFQRNAQTARKVKPEVQPNLKVRENKKLKSKAQLVKEQRKAFVKTVRVIAVAVLCLGMITLVLNSFATKNELTKQIAMQETQIANAQSEHISLQSKLDSLVSISMIDEYAVNKLGMTKVKSNQIQYMDVSEYKAKREKAIEKSSPAEIAKALSQTASNN